MKSRSIKMSSHFFRCDPRGRRRRRRRARAFRSIADSRLAGTNNSFFSISASLGKLINAGSSLRGLSKKFPTLIRNVSPESPL